MSRIGNSANAMTGGQAERKGTPAAQQAVLEQALRHRDLVRAYEKAIETCLKSVLNLAAFTAQLERLKRKMQGGGSVSSTLFIGESLCKVTVAGKKASGIRRMRNGWEEPIAFV